MCLRLCAEVTGAISTRKCNFKTLNDLWASLLKFELGKN